MSIRDLCNACYGGDMQTVETILAVGEVDVNTGHPDGGQYSGATPLMYA